MAKMITCRKTADRSLHEMRCMMLRAKMGISDMEAPSNDSGVQFERIKTIVRGGLTVKECLRYVLDKKHAGNDKNEEICRCGQKRASHIRDDDFDESNENKEWDEDDDIKSFPSNAFGQILFKSEHPGTRKPSSYVRLSEPTDADWRARPYATIKQEAGRIDSYTAFMELLDCLKLFDPYPSLAVAVIGGSKQFRLQSKSLDKFSHGLVKVASATNAWIFTEGYNYGIPRLVGEVVRDGQTLSYDDGDTPETNAEGKIRLIGITPWGLVKNRESLIVNSKRKLHLNNRQSTAVNDSGSLSVSTKTGTPHPSAKLHDDVIFTHLDNPVRMYTLQKPASKGEVHLNPDHNHFIFVDNGYRGVNCKKENRFMVLLLNKLFGRNKSTSPNTKPEKLIPAVVIVMNGGARVIHTVHYCVSMSIPVIICRNTGRAADVFAAAHRVLADLRNASETYDDPPIPDRTDKNFILIRTKLINEIFKEKSESSYIGMIDQLTIKVFETVRREQMVTIYDLGSEVEFESAILSALFKVSDKIKPQDQIELALKWDRSDIAEEKIFSVHTWKEISEGDESFFNNVMQTSLLNSKLGFLALLINRGYSINEYLTADVLLQLYTEALKGDKFIQKLLTNFRQKTVMAKLSSLRGSKRTKDENKENQRRLRDLNKIFQFIASLISYQVPEIATDINEQMKNPYRELFVWAVMFNHVEMANFFWRKMENPVMTALMGAYLFQALGDRASVYDGDRQDDYLQSKSQFEVLATDVLNKCGFMDNHMAKIVLRKPHEIWGKIDCMGAAAQANCKKFLGSVMCQDLLNERWQLKVRSSWPVICLGIIFFPLVPLFIQFDMGQSVSNAVWRKVSRLLTLYKGSRVDDIMLSPDPDYAKEKSHAAAKAERRSYRLRSQYSIFFRAPVTKFCFSAMAGFLYLALYTYFLLFAYHDPSERVDRPLEYFLHAWTFTFFVEAVRAIAQAPTHKWTTKLTWWFRLVFNITDGVALMLYALGFILRMISESYSKDNSDQEYQDMTFASKCFFAFALFLFVVRLLNLLNVSTALGPQIVMCGNMLKELGNYLLLLVLFILAFGIYHSAILYDGQLPTSTVTLIVSYSFWPFIAGPNLDEVTAADTNEGIAHCSADNTNNQCPNPSTNSSIGRNASESMFINLIGHQNSTTLTRSVRAVMEIANSSNFTNTNDSFIPVPFGFNKNESTTLTNSLNDDSNKVAASWFLSAWLALWVLLAFMLMNLLIAIFSNVYEEISKNSSEIWKYYQYQTITEFESKPIFPPPLSLLELIWRLCYLSIMSCRKLHAKRMRELDDEISELGDDSQNRHLTSDPVLQFEREAQAAVYRDKRRARLANSVTQLDDIHSQLATIAKQVACFTRLETMAEQVVMENFVENNEAGAAESDGSAWHAIFGNIQTQRLSKKQKQKEEGEQDQTNQTAEEPSKDESKPLSRKSSDMLRQVLRSESPEASPRESEQRKQSSGGGVAKLEERIDLLSQKLESMQRISALLKDTIKSSPMQSAQPVKPPRPPFVAVAPPSGSPDFRTRPPHSVAIEIPPLVPVEMQSAAVKSGSFLMLPVAGLGLTAVPKPAVAAKSVKKEDSSDAK